MYAREYAGRLRFAWIERYLSLALWLVAASVFFSIASQWIIFSSYDRSFNDYVNSVVQRAAVEHRPTQEVRSLLLLKAEELSIPVRAEQINVRRDKDTLRTIINYGADVKIPVVHRVLYRMEFSHDVAHKATP